jgi:hypothetical protein
MKIFLILLAMLAWIAIWNLFDMATDKFTKTQKGMLYISILVAIVIIVAVHPPLLDRF